jgi:hypothetical protein
MAHAAIDNGGTPARRDDHNTVMARSAEQDQITKMLEG